MTRRPCSICHQAVDDRAEYRFDKAHLTCVMMRERGLTFTDGTVPWVPRTRCVSGDEHVVGPGQLDLAAVVYCAVCHEVVAVVNLDGESEEHHR